MKNAVPTRFRRLLLLLGLGLAAGMPGAARALEATAWKFRQTIEVPGRGVVTVTVPPETLDAARADLGDLRLVNPAGEELAFAVRSGAPPPARPAAATTFRANLGAASTQLLIEVGDAPAEVVLETPAGEFVKRARVEHSADGRAWQLGEDGVPLFRQGGISRLHFAAPARFVRVTVDDTRSRPVPFTGAQVRSAARPALRAPLGVRLVRREEFAGETVLTLELAARHVPLDTLTLGTPERLFTRRVSIGVRAVGEEGTVERVIAGGTLYRLALEGDAGAASLTLPLAGAAPSRELLVHLANDDSPPLALGEIQITQFAVFLQFDAPAPGAYALLTGHPQIAAPRYDLARLDLGAPPAAGAIMPGPLQPNPGHQAPETLAGTPLLGAELDAAGWSFRKAVQLAAPGVQQLEFDLDVLVHAQPGLADVRLLTGGRQVPYLLERPALARSLPLPLAPAPDPQRPRVSRWQLTLPRAGLPVSRLTLSSPTALFQRQIQIWEPDPGGRDPAGRRLLATASWSRLPGDRRSLTVPLAAAPVTASLIIETDNGDNPPLALSDASAAYPVTRILFKSESTPIALYYGHRTAAAPRYDLMLVAGQILAAEKQIATLAAEEALPAGGWARTALGAGRGGILFWGALALVVVVLLVVVARLLPKPPPPPA